MSKVKISGKDYTFDAIKLYKDRHGKWHCYYRPTNEKLLIPHEAGYRAFKDDYARAVRGQEAGQKPEKKVRLEISRSGTVETGVDDYLKSDTFNKTLAEKTRKFRSCILRAWIKDPAIGGLKVATLRPEDIEKGLKNRKDKPNTANNWLIAVRMLMEHLVETKRYGIKKNPTADVKRLEIPDTGGWVSWTEEGVAAFDATFPKGTKQYLAKELLLALGQRRGDVLGFGWHMVTPDGEIEFTQKKTGTEMSLPLPQSLLEVLPPRSNIVGIDGKGDKTPFLLTGQGTPFSDGYFTEWMGAAWDEAGKLLPELPDVAPVHGARKLGAQRLYRKALRSGRTMGEALAITMAYTGHTSEKQLRRYLGKGFERKEYADDLKSLMA